RRDTLRHRLEARMAAAGVSGVEDYLRLLEESAHEIDGLMETLVVPVTEFFRDAWVFHELAQHVLPELMAFSSPVRIWVVGTGSGEEAYSLAMLLEQSGAEYRILGTDIDEPSLRTARAGVYVEERVSPVP